MFIYFEWLLTRIQFSLRSSFSFSISYIYYIVSYLQIIYSFLFILFSSHHATQSCSALQRMWTKCHSFQAQHGIGQSDQTNTKTRTLYMCAYYIYLYVFVWFVYIYSAFFTVLYFCVQLFFFSIKVH